MRRDRNIGDCGMTTGATSAARTTGVIVFGGARTGPTFGNPRNPQHERMPVQLSGVTGGEVVEMRLV